MEERTRGRRCGVLLILLHCVGCRAALGLDDYRIDGPMVLEHAAEPRAAPPRAAGAPVPASPPKPSHRVTADAGIEPRLRASSHPSSAQDAGRGEATREASTDDDAGMVEATAREIGLVAQYHALDAEARDSVLAPALKIVNRSSAIPIPLRSLTLRYYFTNEHFDACPERCMLVGYYSGIHPAGTLIEPERTYVADPTALGRAYIEISFPRSDDALGLGESAEVQQQFHTNPYKEFDESNDYSFRSSPSSFADWDRVTLYREGQLIWGTPPRH